MAGGGTRTFLEPDHYEASLCQAQIKAVLVPNGRFGARLTWAELHDLQVLRCELVHTGRPNYRFGCVLDCRQFASERPARGY